MAHLVTLAPESWLLIAAWVLAPASMNVYHSYADRDGKGRRDRKAKHATEGYFRDKPKIGTK